MKLGSSYSLRPLTLIFRLYCKILGFGGSRGAEEVTGKLLFPHSPSALKFLILLRVRNVTFTTRMRSCGGNVRPSYSVARKKATFNFKQISDIQYILVLFFKDKYVPPSRGRYD